MKRSLITLTIISVFLALYLIGCGGGDGVSGINSLPNTNNGTGELVVSVEWPATTDEMSASLIPSATSKIKIEVQKTDGTALVPAVYINKDQTTGTVSNVPTGPAQVYMAALDAGGNPLSVRIKPITVVSGSNPMTAELGLMILPAATAGGKATLSPNLIPIQPTQTLYVTNLDSTKTYYVRFNLNGRVVDLGPIASTDAETTWGHKFSDSEMGTNINANLYEGPPNSNPSIATVTFQATIPGGSDYTSVDRIGEISADPYDCNNGWTFLTADSDENIFVGIYNPHDVFNVGTAYESTNYIYKYNNTGARVQTTSPQGFITTTIDQILSIAVDHQGKYLYVAGWDRNEDPQVWRYDAVSGGNPSSLAYPGSFYQQFQATENTAARNVLSQGIAIGYVKDPSGTAVEQWLPNWLYVIDANTGNANPELHVADIRTNAIPSATKWDADTSLGASWPGNITPDVVAIPVDVTVSADNLNLYIINNVEHTADPAVNPIKAYRASDCSDVAVEDVPFTNNLGNVSERLCQIEAYTSPSMASGSFIYAISSVSADDNARPDDNGKVWRYNGVLWEALIDDLQKPVGSYDTNLTTQRAYVPCLLGGYSAMSTGNPYIDAINGSAVVEMDGTEWYGINAGGVGTHVAFGLQHDALSLCILPNDNGKILVGDIFHHVSLYNKSVTLTTQAANLLKDWRFPYESFAFPFGLSDDASGNIYLTDAGNCRVIKMAGATGNAYIGQWGIPVDDPTDTNYVNLGLGTTIPQFNAPVGIDVDAAGNVFVMDRDVNPDATNVDLPGYNRGRMQQFPTTAGTFCLNQSGPTVMRYRSAFKHFYWPTGIATDGTDLFIADTGKGPITLIDTDNSGVQRIGIDGSSKVVYTGSTIDDYPMSIVKDAALDPDRHICYASDAYNRILKYDITTSTCVGQISTIAPSQGISNGQFDHPDGLEVDTLGYVYVTDTGNARMQKFTPYDGTDFSSSNGWVATWNNKGQSLQFPWAVIVPSAGSRSGFVYITERIIHRELVFQAVQ